MLDEYNQAIQAYYQKWQELVNGCSNKDWFESLQPTSIGWKMQDRAELDSRFLALIDLCDQVHLGWINERWLATLHLKDTTLEHHIKVIKLMECRPGSSDAVGLDHLDFYSPQVDKKLLEEEPRLQWTEEKNGDHCKWLSVWFAGTEAKLRKDTVLEVCADELMEVQAQLIDKKT